MSQSPPVRRIEILEENPDARDHLPARLDALTLQIVQFRDDVRDDIAATRYDLKTDVSAWRADVTSHLDALTIRVDALCARMETLSSRFDAARIDTFRDDLHAEIRQGDEEIRRSMRVLHDLVMARIGALRDSRVTGSPGRR